MESEDLPRDRIRASLDLNVRAQRFRETFGETALEQLAAAWFKPLENRGKNHFGKTSVQHLQRRYMDKSQPLWLRLVDYTKVHARYPNGYMAIPQLTHTPRPRELAAALLGQPAQTDAGRKALYRALVRAKRHRMLDDSSRLDLLILPPGEWDKSRHTW